MKRRIENELARLASQSYHDRYIVNATRDEYVLPDEMLESALAVIENTLRSNVLSRGLSQRERFMLDELAAKLRPLQATVDFDTSGRQLVDSDEWRAVQDYSAAYLENLGFDLVQWEKANITS